MGQNVINKILNTVNNGLRFEYPDPVVPGEPKYWLIYQDGQIHVRSWVIDCDGRRGDMPYVTGTLQDALRWIHSREYRPSGGCGDGNGKKK